MGSKGIETTTSIVIIIIGISILGGYILLSQGPGNEEGSEEWVEYSNSKFHYKIEYPSSWNRKVLYNGAMVDLRSSGPRNRTLVISVTKQYENSLAKFVEEKVLTMENDPKYENATFSVENITLGDRGAKLVDIRNASSTIQGEEFILRQKYVATFIKVDGIRHPLGLLFTAEQSDKESWKEVFPHIMENFKFT